MAEKTIRNSKDRLNPIANIADWLRKPQCYKLDGEWLGLIRHLNAKIKEVAR